VHVFELRDGSQHNLLVFNVLWVEFDLGDEDEGVRVIYVDRSISFGIKGEVLQNV
jgi:hypothetical protein